MFVYFVGAGAMCATATVLSTNRALVTAAFQRPRHIGDLPPTQAAYFRTVIITMTTVFAGFAADYVVFQLRSSALTWFEICGIIGGSLSFLIKCTRGIGSLVMYCIPIPPPGGRAPFPIGLPPFMAGV